MLGVKRQGEARAHSQIEHTLAWVNVQCLNGVLLTREEPTLKNEIIYPRIIRIDPLDLGLLHTPLAPSISGTHEGALLVSAEPKLKWGGETLATYACQHLDDIVVRLKERNVARSCKLDLDHGQRPRRRIAQYRYSKLASINELFNQHRLRIGVHEIRDALHQGGVGFDNRVVR